MADEGLKDFSVNWVVAGLLTFCLIAFTITFMFNNNPTGLGDASTPLGNSYTSLSNQLISSESGSNELLNITSNTNPEVSDLGSRDSVASAYSVKGQATNYWTSGKILVSWVFSGAIGKMLIAVLSGLIGLLSFFYITKWIRSGQ